MTPRAWWRPTLLAAAVLVSALAVVLAKHHNRGLTTELDRLRGEGARLQVEWAQLQLEEATLAHHGRVEQMARQKLDMAEPTDYVVVTEPAVGGAP